MGWIDVRRSARQILRPCRDRSWVSPAQSEVEWHFFLDGPREGLPAERSGRMGHSETTRRTGLPAWGRYRYRALTLCDEVLAKNRRVAPRRDHVFEALIGEFQDRHEKRRTPPLSAGRGATDICRYQGHEYQREIWRSRESGQANFSDRDSASRRRCTTESRKPDIIGNIGHDSGGGIGALSRGWTLGTVSSRNRMAPDTDEPFRHHLPQRDRSRRATGCQRA